ncbi:retroviral-like aspartic protease family protein [Paraburkholderia sp. D15]|uniref:retroviral-like aspartic protease family protein n=1 Tax=Paraburkholderia sp. D15 TaxID=2880218 RepID=UPI0024787DE3|nr:retroviral-like aspartic protease family protein [Paraburkholderia sp. D15]WGS54083.1 retroviral-like aspartic protease family protein [Paraburkholderia sp. D15]
MAILLAGCDLPLPDDIKPAVEKYHLNSVASSDLTAVNLSRALTQLSRESCNRDAMDVLAVQLGRMGYRREAANALTQFVDQCGRVDGFLNAAADDLIAVSDYRAAMAVADRLVQLDAINPQFYFMRGRAREGAQDYENALADYMQALALVPDLSQVNGDLFVRAADMHAKAGRYCEAISMIRMWASAEPGRATQPQAVQQIAAYSAHQSCPSTYATGDDTFPRQPGKTIRVKALVNGVSGTFIVDTGATYALLTRRFAQRAQVSVDRASKIQMTTVNGQRQALLTSATSIKVGRAEAQHVELTVDGAEASSLGDGVDGLLGQSFLSRFKTEFTPTRWSIRPAGLKG